MCYIHLIILVAMAVIGAAPVGAEPSDIGQVDTILDRLEKRLLDQEADGLTFGERQNDPAFMNQPEAKSLTKYKFNKTKIEGANADAERLKAVGSLIGELETQVDQLASSVQKTKQSILDDAAIDNFITLEAQLADTDAAAIKTLSVKLDGYSVYELSEATGLWMPSKTMPLYAGPLQPGSHRVDLEARIVVRHKDKLPMNGDIYRFISKSFDLTINGGSSNSRYVIAITPPAKIDGTADATIKEAL